MVSELKARQRLQAAVDSSRLEQEEDSDYDNEDLLSSDPANPEQNGQQSEYTSHKQKSEFESITVTDIDVKSLAVAEEQQRLLDLGQNPS